MIGISNGRFHAEVSERGCELTSFFDKEAGREYLWQAGTVWQRHAPVLFPNIGGFVDGSYLVDGKEYRLPPHGFARDSEFEVVERHRSFVEMQMRSNPKTKEMYPFDFVLAIRHEVTSSGFTTKWIVRNTGRGELLFSIGAHPGFLLARDTELSDYSVQFDKVIPLRTRRVRGRLVTQEKVEIGPPTSRIDLTPDLLRNDALIFEEGLSSITLACDRADYRLKVGFEGFPVVAIWSNAEHIDEAEFVCIEPWFGINDYVGGSIRELVEKDLIQHVDPGQDWCRSFSVEILK